MAVINVTDGTQAILTLGNTSTIAQPGNAAGLVIPLVQDLTLTAQPGTVRYSTLDSDASSSYTTTNENSVSLNMLVDEAIFFGNASASGNQVEIDGLLQTSKNKTEIFWSVAFDGDDSGSNYISGSGYIGGLAPTASIDAAVWLSPMEIIVNGEISKATVT